MPDEYDEFNDFKVQKKLNDKFFIYKPTNSSCGRGIKVLPGNAKISRTEEFIVSCYLDRPLLINQKKFDMRMYVVVTSYNPLRIYFYNEGLARFATEEYSNDPKILKNKFVHLTNFSINKRNIKFVRNDNRTGSASRKPGNDEDEMIDEDPEQESSSKWSLTFLKKYLRKKMTEEGYAFKKDEDIFSACHDAIIKTLIAVEPEIVKEMDKVGNRQKCCFEVYGFDIIFDNQMKPWVLEVNCLPSLSSSSIFDK